MLIHNAQESLHKMLEKQNHAKDVRIKKIVQKKKMFLIKVSLLFILNFHQLNIKYLFFLEKEGLAKVQFLLRLLYSFLIWVIKLDY